MARGRPAAMVLTAALVSSVSFGAAATAAPEARHTLGYHGGPVMLQDTNYVIFWEPQTLQDGTPTHVSSTYNTLVERYFRDVGGSGLYANDTQYYQVRNGRKRFIRDSSILGGAWLDTGAYPSPGCFDPYTPRNCVSDKQVRAEVLKAMQVNGWTAGHSHLFFVFTSYGEGSCVAGRITPGCSFARFCAWHNFFRSGGRMVVYANQPYAGTRLDYCGVPASPNHDPDADSTLSLVSHEQMEAVTDPSYRAWWRGPDSETGEIADICFIWDPLDEDGGKANQLWNGHAYILQDEWSNAARGCVQEGP